jgi:chemotaxis protein MotB
MPQWFGSLALSVAVIAGLTGCVSQEQYNALKMKSDRLTEQLANAERDGSTARAEADLYKKSLDAIKGNGANQAGLIANLTTTNSDLRAQLDALNAKYGDAIKNIASTGVMLPTALNNDLSEFAKANPDLVEFDEARGIVKFKSDLTFAVGSADLRPQAKSAIARFAQIVNSPNAANYELLVAGHTDNTRVVNPATIAAGNKDNWYLSANRAISVGKELIAHNTNPQRLGVVGYADQRPIADNSTDAGRSKNRRVEVLILPSTVRSAPVSTSVTPAPKTAPAAGFNKDNVAAPAPVEHNK